MMTLFWACGGGRWPQSFFVHVLGERWRVSSASSGGVRSAARSAERLLVRIWAGEVPPEAREPAASLQVRGSPGPRLRALGCISMTSLARSWSWAGLHGGRPSGGRGPGWAPGLGVEKSLRGHRSWGLGQVPDPSVRPPQAGVGRRAEPMLSMSSLLSKKRGLPRANWQVPFEKQPWGLAPVK